MRLRPLLTAIILTTLLGSLALADDPPWIARGTLGMVASDSPEASQRGARVLGQGGNAFDAAIATSLSLAVARPHSTALGGGGFLVAYLADERRCVVLDFREMAPAAATAERYAKLQADAENGPSPTVYGGNAVGVPGLLAGLDEIRRRYGTCDWPQLAEPAIELTQEGFVADDHYVQACQGTLAAYEKWPRLKEQCPRLYQTLLNNGTPPKVGDTIRRPELEDALRLIRERGPAALYGGEIGAAIVRAVHAAGGQMTESDLASYQVCERTPLRVPYRAYEIVGMPPPSSGGICIAETLNILNVCTDRSDLGPRSGPHTLVEATKHAFADRARWLGDPDFCDVPTARLTSVTYAATLAQRIHPAKTQPSEAYGTSPTTTAPAPDRGTSHFCVVDRLGNVVALTETINGPFGSCVIAEPFGIILNNEMDDFATNPGKPNLFGLIQGEANAVAPGKRPLSSMSPTLVFKDGKPVLAVGASGGPLIITSVLQVLLNVTDREMPLDQAMAAVRLHHQWLPNEVAFDQTPPTELADALRAAGHTLSERHRLGIVQAIQILPDGTLIGASDPRKGGRPSGLR